MGCWKQGGQPSQDTLKTREPWAGEGPSPASLPTIHTCPTYLPLPPVSYKGRGLVGRMSFRSSAWGRALSSG